MEWLLVIGALFLLSRRGGMGQPVNPNSYTTSPNAIIGGALNMGGSQSTPLLSSALNGAGRPLTPGFGYTVGGPQSDPNYGDPGAGQATLGGDASPGINPGVITDYAQDSPTSFGISGDIVTSYDQWG
jgi:hypothetical protein